MEKKTEDIQFLQVGTVSLDPNSPEEDSEELRNLKKKLSTVRPTKTLYEQLEEQREWKILEKKQEEENRFRPAYLDDEEALYVNQLKEREELLFEYSKQKEREDIEAFEEARAKKLLAKASKINENYGETQNEKEENESPLNTNNKKRKASDIDSTHPTPIINEPKPIIVIRKKMKKKDKDKTKQYANIKSEINSRSTDCPNSSISCTTKINQRKEEGKSTMHSLLGAYNDSDDEDADMNI